MRPALIFLAVLLSGCVSKQSQSINPPPLPPARTMTLQRTTSVVLPAQKIFKVGFRFDIDPSPWNIWTMEYSSDLLTWNALTSFYVSSQTNVIYSDSITQPVRFYRLTNNQ